jgi:hypothetical protein
MKIRPKTNYQLPITNYQGASGTISTTVERSLQIHLFMQNKPNLRKSQVNVNKVLTRDYEQRTLGKRGKNKPNSNPIQSQFKPNQSQNKANSNPNKPNFTLTCLCRLKSMAFFGIIPPVIGLIGLLLWKCRDGDAKLMTF